MALPSRLGAFMVGTAIGSAQCFYFLYKDVQNVTDAMTRKIQAVKAELNEKDRLAELKLSAIESAIGNASTSTSAIPNPSPS